MTGPEKSPEPEYLGATETPSGSHRAATKGDLVEHEHRETVVAWFSSLSGALVVLIGLCTTLTGGVWFVLSTASAQTKQGVDAGTEPLRSELHGYMRESDARFARLEAASQRQDLKADAILLGLHLPNPAPTPADGGP